ncbi:hypothetical protein ON010_g3762 [Phytophthora cinnamomi]|nr:hypothetical protein ON010_g3762 [Phytophthora cinnamomi]
MCATPTSLNARRGGEERRGQPAAPRACPPAPARRPHLRLELAGGHPPLQDHADQAAQVAAQAHAARGHAADRQGCAGAAGSVPAARAAAGRRRVPALDDALHGERERGGLGLPVLPDAGHDAVLHGVVLHQRAAAAGAARRAQRDAADGAVPAAQRRVRLHPLVPGHGAAAGGLLPAGGVAEE